MLDFNLGAVSEEQENLRKLHRLLTYALSGAGFAVLVLFVAYRHILLLLVLAAIVGTPVMFWRLYKARRHGWIVGFVLTVGLPFLCSRLVDPANMVIGFLQFTFPLVTFVFYTWLLRQRVREWLLGARYRTEMLAEGP